MRRAGRTDANQAEIVKKLRACGCSVWVTSSLGGGFPDLVVARPGCGNVLLEVKDGNLPPSARQLTPKEQAFHHAWRGPVYVVTSVAEALAAVGLSVRLTGQG